MKKLCRKISAVLSAVVLMATASVSVSAENIYPGIINNEAYMEFISDLTPMPDKVLEIMNKNNEDSEKILRMYCTSDVIIDDDYNSSVVYYERGDENYRRFSISPCLNWKKLYISQTDADIEVVREDINNFLIENNYAANVILESSYDKSSYEYLYNVELEYDENLSDEEILDIVQALTVNYNAFPSGIVWSIMLDKYVNMDTFTEGDFNCDGVFSTADLIMISKHMANDLLYPIKDMKALINADVNNDDVINSLDVNILIEHFLGNFESAV